MTVHRVKDIDQVFEDNHCWSLFQSLLEGETWEMTVPIPSFSCSTLSVPSCHTTRRLHEGWDTARLAKPRQGNSRGRGRLRTTDLPVKVLWSHQRFLISDGSKELLKSCSFFLRLFTIWCLRDLRASSYWLLVGMDILASVMDRNLDEISSLVVKSEKSGQTALDATNIAPFTFCQGSLTCSIPFFEDGGLVCFLMTCGGLKRIELSGVHAPWHDWNQDEMPQWLDRELIDWKVHGWSPTSGSRLLLSRLGQFGIISALVLPSGSMAVRHRKVVTAEQLTLLLYYFSYPKFSCFYFTILLIRQWSSLQCCSALHISIRVRNLAAMRRGRQKTHCLTTDVFGALSGS
ncbi:hypothetical protein CSKR_111477, partial [Clonorchis sinensis]